MTVQPSGEIILYQRADGAPTIEVRFDAETVWLSQQQIAELFETSRTNIVEHIRHIYQDGELDEAATCRKFRQVRTEGSRQVAREVPVYNLDLIISVGYRVRTSTATQFRIWATERLREYLVRGYTINHERLEQLGSIVQILTRSTDELVAGVADVLAGYLPGLILLRDYDQGRVDATPDTTPGWALTLDEARAVISQVASEFPDDTFFGNERGDALKGVIGALYQGFAGQDLYLTVEEKAANLLYLVVKDHPLSDGNKRSAAALFVTFLARNELLTGIGAAPSITSNALAAITLMVAMSDPREKELMIGLIIRMIVEGAA
ncbi:virulence protein RhuM/Fic/DOC family protein [Herbiconiux sp. CPCC 205716]|uniref:Virulence protein RhuM/Fic/DOC family protein n=1 Tax=Herbiconiux gentiana TaxID=2970912 RepID=A0ABT2GF68_9MICO|nr:virulence protein RhuM/Fic/DOC family protein [Herbiconiux gentiana]MCS5713539.1 virulence protein RhuM/Fic/DOC family protein [Herbiconiux gentiana]